NSGSAQRSLGGQVIDFEAPIIAIATERLPAIQWIAQRDSERSFLRSSGQRISQPGMQRIEYRACASLAFDAALFGRSTPDLALDPIKPTDLNQCVSGLRRLRCLVQLHKAAPAMRPARTLQDPRRFIRQRRPIQRL